MLVAHWVLLIGDYTNNTLKMIFAHIMGAFDMQLHKLYPAKSSLTALILFLEWCKAPF